MDYERTSKKCKRKKLLRVFEMRCLRKIMGVARRERKMAV